MRHDIGKKIFFNVLKKTKVIKKIKDFKFGAKKKIINKGSSILYRQQVVYKHFTIKKDIWEKMWNTS